VAWRDFVGISITSLEMIQRNTNEEEEAEAPILLSSILPQRAHFRLVGASP
jgi:hypothetical protein